jgi:uncharacterized protein (DUF2384 family)
MRQEQFVNVTCVRCGVKHPKSINAWTMRGAITKATVQCSGIAQGDNGRRRPCVRHRRLGTISKLGRGGSMTERQEVHELVAKFFCDDVKAHTWMREPNPLLGGFAPKDLIAIRPGKVLAFVKQSLAENERR